MSLRIIFPEFDGIKNEVALGRFVISVGQGRVPCPYPDGYLIDSYPATFLPIVIVPSRFTAMGGRCCAAKVIPFFSYVTNRLYKVSLLILTLS